MWCTRFFLFCLARTQQEKMIKDRTDIVIERPSLPLTKRARREAQVRVRCHLSEADCLFCIWLLSSACAVAVTVASVAISHDSIVLMFNVSRSEAASRFSDPSSASFSSLALNCRLRASLMQRPRSRCRRRCLATLKPEMRSDSAENFPVSQIDSDCLRSSHV